MMFWFVDASIYYTLIIQIFQLALWCVIWFTLDILSVVSFRSIWWCGTHAFWLTISHILPHMVSTSTVLYLFSYEFQIQNINWGQPTSYRVYPHIISQTHRFLLLRVTLFLTYRPTNPDPVLLFSDFKYYGSRPPQEMLDDWIILSLCAILHFLRYRSIESLTYWRYMLPMQRWSRSNLANLFLLF